MNNKEGYTLIEMIVVIAVIGLVLPALFSIIFVILQQQLRIYTLQEIKRQGDTAMSIMENTIRNSAQTIYASTIPDNCYENLSVLNNEICSTVSDLTPATASDGKNFCFKDKDGNGFSFWQDVSKISSSSSLLVSPVDLTTNKVQITNLSFQCSRKATYSTPIVVLSFTIQSGTTSFTYNSRIKIRTY